MRSWAVVPRSVGLGRRLPWIWMAHAPDDIPDQKLGFWFCQYETEGSGNLRDGGNGEFTLIRVFVCDSHDFSFVIS